MRKFKRMAALLMTAALAATAFTGCNSNPSTSNSSSGSSGSSDSSSNKPDTSQEVNLIYYFWGSDAVANKDILAEINAKLKEDINATITPKYIDWGETATKYPLLFASGEQFDLSEVSPTFPATYSDLANDGVLADLTDLLDSVPDLKAEIPEKYWDATKVNGKIYGVPTLYVAFNSYGIVTRDDLLEKYGVDEVNSLETFEAYADAAVADGIVPLNGNSYLGNDLWRMFVTITGEWWPEVPGINQGEMSLAAESAENYKEIFHPAFTDEFVEFAKKMREWADKGYWGKDVMSAPKDEKDNFLVGTSAAWITHQPDWTGSYGSIQSSKQLQGVGTEFWCFGLDNGKIKRMPCTENMMAVSSTSSNPERALMAIEKFMTNEEYYRLITSGIEGRQYEIVDGVIQTPESYDETKDAGGFTVWAMRNDRFNLLFATEDPRRAEQNKEWDKIAIDDPYLGFAFDNTAVSTELAAVTNVNATLGNQIMLGKTTDDPETAVQKYRDQLTSAGVDKIIEEVKRQLEEYEKSK